MPPPLLPFIIILIKMKLKETKSKISRKSLQGETKIKIIVRLKLHFSANEKSDLDGVDIMSKHSFKLM